MKNFWEPADKGTKSGNQVREPSQGTKVPRTPPLV
jgi:hypothetical protein